MAAQPNVLYSVEGGVATIRLNRPEKRNAMSQALLAELDAALSRAEDDSAVAVLVIRGNGPVFCAGYDLTPNRTEPSHEDGIPDLTLDRKAELTNINRWLRIWDFPKPVIACVHGFAVAGGLELALFCDITIATEDARIGNPIARGTGTSPAQITPWLIGMKKAKELLFTGDTLSGKEAAELGLINRAVPAAALEHEVYALANRIAQMPRDLIWLNKAGVNRSCDIMGFRNAINYGFELHIIGHHAASTQRFHAIRNTKGLKTALEDRDGRFARQSSGD